ncbi:MAG: sugar ABC transporter permease [Candidatus Hadarchaeales archaeon]
MRNDEKTAYIFLAIPLVCVGFILFTIFYLIGSSFFTNEGLGFQNYVRLFTLDQYFWPALWHNVFWMIWAVLVPIGIGLIFATLLSRNIRGENIFKGIIYFPALLAGATIGVIWKWFYLPRNGVINSILKGFGLMGLGNPTTELWINNSSPPVPLLTIISLPIFFVSILLIALTFSPRISRLKLGLVLGIGGIAFPIWLFLSGAVSTSLVSILIASSWAGSAVSMVMFLAGMQAIPKSHIEAAKVDGASEWQVLRHVVLPALKPVMVTLIILSAISSMKAFDLVYTLAGQEGGPGHHAADVLALYTFRTLKSSQDLGGYSYASTIGFIGILVSLVPVILYMIMLRRKEEDT